MTGLNSAESVRCSSVLAWRKIVLVSHSFSTVCDALIPLRNDHYNWEMTTFNIRQGLKHIPHKASQIPSVPPKSRLNVDPSQLRPTCLTSTKKGSSGRRRNTILHECKVPSTWALIRSHSSCCRLDSGGLSWTGRGTTIVPSDMTNPPLGIGIGVRENIVIFGTRTCTTPRITIISYSHEIIRTDPQLKIWGTCSIWLGKVKRTIRRWFSSQLFGLVHRLPLFIK